MNVDLLDRLRDKTVLIWGARVVGMGLYRACLANDINVQCLIDSDPAFRSQKIMGVPIYAPDSLPALRDSGAHYSIVIAVSIKQDEIKQQIKYLLSSDSDTEVIDYADYSSTFYTIDIVDACNLSCLSCAHSSRNLDVPKGIMPFDKVTQVLDKIQEQSPECTHVSLYSWGEPLLHPDLAKIIHLFHSRNIAVGLSSNLSHSNPRILSELIIANPDYLKVSVSGYYPEAYNSTHQGGDINVVKSNLYRLRHLIDKHNSSTVVDINYHLYRNNNKHNLQSMKRLAAELSFAFSTVHALVMPLERVMNYKNGLSDEYSNTALIDNMLVTIDEGIEASSSVDIKAKCPFRENQLNINSDLSVPVCCTVYNRSHLVSQNFLDSSLPSINHAKRLASICNECMNLGLPQYNMGFNREELNRIASTKTSTDIGDNAISS